MDDDEEDTVSVSYDLTEVEEFMVLNGQELVIEDLSSPDVPIGEFYI